MIKVGCLGGFREVGGNAVLIDNGKERVLLDYGMRVETAEIPLPPKRVDALLLAHPHLDHVGASPVLYRSHRGPPCYATAATFDQAHMILKDSVKVAKLRGMRPNFRENDILKMGRYENVVNFGDRFRTKTMRVSVHDAGHVPGSAMFILESGRKRILYTSDFNTKSTRLLNGAKVRDLKNIDVLITESTYSSRDHTPRAETEKRLREIVADTIEGGGVAVIPVFAIGRSAEILLVLNEMNPDFPVYLDGMARKATEIALQYPHLLRNPKALRKTMSYVKSIHSDEDRTKALKRPCAIITTSGVVEGGPAVYYIKRLYSKPNSSLIFTGFMIPRTAGRYLQDTGRFVTAEFDLKVKMRTEYLDFSAHVGRTELLNFVKGLSPKKVICMHGDNCERFATELRGRFELDALAPKTGDVIKID